MKRFHQAIPSSFQSRACTGLSVLLALGAAVACGSEAPSTNSDDANGDGVADYISGPFLDTNGDGILDSVDRNIDGTPDGSLIDSDGDGIFDAVDLDGDGNGDGSGGAANPGSGGNGSGNANASGGRVGNSGGSSSGGGGNPDGSGGAVSGDCQFTISAAPAELMPTVGVVEFSVTGLPGAVTEGKIEFGLTTEYGMEAPLDVAAPMYKTLLIGMKKQKEYNYRITASSGGTSCTSDNQTITSGNLRSGINDNIQKSVTGTVGKGFYVVAAGSTALIFDQDGDVVWGYAFSASGVGGTAGIFSAKMTFDGKYMLARDLGQFNAGNQGKFFRVAMDGSGLTDFDVPGGDHHDFTIIPTGFAYIAKEAAGEYDKIYTSKDDGSDAKVFADLEPLIAAYPQSGGASMGEMSHVNAIHHWRDRDIYTVSNRESDVIGVVNNQSQIIQGIGRQATATFDTVLADGTGSTWRVQHGHDLYAPDKLLVFSNGNFGGGTSRALHYTISGNTATLDWEYSATGNSPTQGDVQLLPDGNIAITASMVGTIHVINAQQQLQASYKVQSFGYSMFRSSLYGEPPDGR